MLSFKFHPMASMRLVKLVSIVLGCLILNGLTTASASAQANRKRIVIITSPETTAIDCVSLDELKSIFAKRLFRVKGSEVIPVQRKPASELRKAFNRLVLKADEDQLKTYWIEEKLAGRESPPKTFDSINSVVAFLKKKPGAISYVCLDDLDEEKRREVQIIPVKVGKDKVAPEDENYPLRY
ncbi:MAG TPA: hypothetical protein PKO06_12670 [Candidatus Ozemobacteraceae bacterium]|nr:hypothetical protein [Candidatus Ozemobacteraceae bacterium]